MDEIRRKRYREQLFGVRRSVRYHVRRRRFLQLMQDISTFLSVLFGSATFASIAAEILVDWPSWASLIPAAVVTFMSSLSLVFGFGRRASLHADLARRFIALERLLEAGWAEPSEDLIRQAISERLLIETDEPPVLRTLDVLCHNELARGMGHDLEQYYRVAFWRRCLVQVFSFSNYATSLRPAGQSQG